MTSVLRIAAVLSAAALLACSRPGAPSIHGRWAAEDESIGSLVFPGGPELDISAGQVFIPRAKLAIPIASEEAGEGAVTLKTSVGLGWTFFFEATDRMYVDVPFAGRVYYRRLPAGASILPAAAAVPTPVVTPIPTPSSVGTGPDPDTALRELDASLRTGRTNAALVEADPRLDALRDDVRYRALLARHR